MFLKNIFPAQMEQQRLDDLKAKETSLESKKNESLKVKVKTLLFIEKLLVLKTNIKSK